MTDGPLPAADAPLPAAGAPPTASAAGTPPQASAAGGRRHRWGRLLAWTGAAAVSLALVAGGGVVGLLALDRAYPPRTVPVAPASTIVVDRAGKLLSAFTTADGRWRLPVDVASVDPRYVEMLIAYEDRRFREHAGVDPLASARAALQAVRYGRLVSGSSTLTMQTARLVEGRTDRTLGRKLLESARALQLERRLTKDEILSLYLALAPYGGNLEGVRAASLAYFGREPDRLTIGQAALLVALPQSPEWRRPDRHPDAARKARDRVLDRMVTAGVLTAEEAASGKMEDVPTARLAFPRLAAHAARAAVEASPDERIVRLTLDRDMQASLEALARERTAALGQKLSAAIVVMDAKTGALSARVGSPDLLDDDRHGHVDLSLAVRSPGSTLKPFIYALAFEAGIAHPETLIEDRPSSFGAYAPKNFDQSFMGTVSAREALRQSLNVPAVKLLDAIGPARLAVRLADAGVELELPRPEAPTLAIGLGGVGVRLVDLTALYGAFVGGGFAPVPYERAGLPPAPPRRLVDPVAAWYVADILAGTPPPANAARDRIAFKTGTSYGYRDAWAIGFDGAHVVGVWVGRPDGAAVPGLVARTAAAPLLFDAFARIGPRRAPLPRAPSGALIATTATLPPTLARLGGDAAAASPGTGPSRLRFAYPPDGARVSLDAGGVRQPLAWRIEGASAAVSLLVDGKPVPIPSHRRAGALSVPQRGFVRLTVVDPTGAADSVTVFVE
jgi:penicillin-binding protein 1C